MPDFMCLALSVGLMALGVMLTLFPQALLQASRSLNRTMMVVDDQLVRHHWLLGAVVFAVSYAVFRLALLLPSLHE